MPPAQSYPSWQPNNTYTTYPAQRPYVPQQAFPPQQSFPPTQPNIGFSPSNHGGDIALDALNRASSDTGNIAHSKPSPIRLRGLSTSQTGDIPQLASMQGNMQNMPGTLQGVQEMQGVQGLQDSAESARSRSEAHSEQLPRLDAPFFRDALNRFNPQEKNEPDGQPPDHPNWL